MRCIALADAWRKAGGEAVLLGECAGALLERAQKSFSFVYSTDGSNRVQETKRKIQVILANKKPESCWIALDGYLFDYRYQTAMRQVGCPLLVIDDFAHLSRYNADIILNQNAGAEEFSYRTQTDTRLLLGTDYVLLREDLLRSKPHHVPITNEHHILITMGGVDAPNMTQEVLQALASTERNDIRVRVLLGSGNPHIASVTAYARSLPLQIETVVQSDNMAEHYTWATTAISAAGTTTWELCYFGVPAMLIQIADNQQAIAEHLGKVGAVVNLGWFEHIGIDTLSASVNAYLDHKSKRFEMSNSARTLVDGKGGERVLSEMTQLSQRPIVTRKLPELIK